MGALISIVLQVVLQIPAVRITLVTVLPSFLLLGYVRKKDKLEPEPPRLIWTLFGLGALAVLLAFLLELGGVFLTLQITEEGTLLYSLLHWYAVVGLFEEASKYLMLRLRTWKNPEFDCLFDGMVYAVAVSAGFALAENIIYLIRYGGSIMLMRAIVSIPAHICFSVIMGSWYSAAKKYDLWGDKQKSTRCRVLAVLVPALAHGLFDHLAVSTESAARMLPFLGYTIAMFIVCWLLIKKLANKDDYYHNIAPQ